MGYIFGFIGLAGFMACLILTIKSDIENSGKAKKFGTGMILSLAILMAGVAVIPVTEGVKTLEDIYQTTESPAPHGASSKISTKSSTGIVPIPLAPPTPPITYND